MMLHYLVKLIPLNLSPKGTFSLSNFNSWASTDVIHSLCCQNKVFIIMYQYAESGGSLHAGFNYKLARPKSNILKNLPKMLLEIF